jgi:putative intracellular protease/amidase
MIITSHKELQNTDTTTGLWLGEFTEPYYAFIDKGYKVTLASPWGGKPPVNPMSGLVEHITASNRRFQDDLTAQDALNETNKLDTVLAGEFDAIFYPGGHGPMFDLATNEISGRLINEFLSKGKPVAAVCHGPAALIKAAESNLSLLKGKGVSGYSNAEEALVLKGDNIPFMLEDRLKELGADYQKATVPFIAYTEVC